MFQSFFAASSSNPLVYCQPGAIRLQDRQLLADPTGEACRAFIERTFTVEAVTGLEIDHRWGQAIIRYAPARSADEVLARLAKALGTPAPARVRALLRQLLAWDPDRRRTRVFRYGDSFTTWELKRLTQQYVQLRHEVIASHRHLARQVCAELTTVPGVLAVRVLPFSNSLLLHVTGPGVEDRLLLERADAALHQEAGWYLGDVVQREVVLAVVSVRRLLNLLLAGCSFIMALIGAVVPGIPTVPFLLLTSYFLLHSSPALNDLLLRSRLFGPMIRDWRQYRAVRRHVKWTLLAVALVLLVLTIWLAGMSGPMLLFVLLLASFSFYMILRIPTIVLAPTVAGETS